MARGRLQKGVTAWLPAWRKVQLDQHSQHCMSGSGAGMGPLGLPASEHHIEDVRCAATMPLWKGQPYTPPAPTLGLTNDLPVYIVRCNGELFANYE